MITLEILSKLPKTPMWEQFSSIKKDALDSLLFYRMGDFYELFLSDAEIAASVLSITLTARNKNEGMPIPMCGVPFHSATAYINKLLKAGHRVAICEQVEEASAGKGIVKREIVRIVSPGVAYDLDSLDSFSENILACLDHNFSDGTGTLATLDASTGELWYATYENLGALSNELNAVKPKEILVSLSNYEMAEWEALIAEAGKEHFSCTTTLPNFYFSPTSAFQDLCAHFKVLNLEACSLGKDSKEIGALAALLRRIKDTQKTANLNHIQPPRPRPQTGFLQLDDATIEHLDLLPRPGQIPNENCFFHLDRTVSSMGARALKRILTKPLTDKSEIEDRQDAIENLLKNDSLLRRLRQQLGGSRDLERLIGKVGLGTVGPRDIQALREILSKLPDLKASLLEFSTASLLKSIHQNIEPFEELQNTLTTQLADELPAHTREGNIFRKGWHSDLDELIDLTENSRAFLIAMEDREKANTGIQSLKIKYNKVFGYFIEVTSSNLKNVPPHYIRKQTTANGERFLTEELKAFEEKALRAEEKRIALEESLFEALLSKVSQQAEGILSTARQLSLLDALQSLASAAIEHNYIKPKIENESQLEIIDGRHPMLEILVGRDKFISNSIHFSSKEKVFIITGPNMAGKSTFMRQVALITLMAQTGSFVPAASATIGIVDRIATRVGASDRIGRGQSTFMVEMNEMAKILRQSTEKSLLIIDEIGRGTSTYDGMALAWAILEDIVTRLNSRCLFATHYHELPALESEFGSIKNLSVAVEEKGGEILFLHRIVKGPASGSYGVEVAKLAGLPSSVVDRATILLQSLEGKSTEAQSKKMRRSLPPPQLDLFSSAPKQPEITINPVWKAIEKELLSLDLDRTTPLDAMLALRSLKERLPQPQRPC